MCGGLKFAKYVPDGPPVLYVLTHEREHACFLFGIRSVETEPIFDRRAPVCASLLAPSALPAGLDHPATS